MREPPSWPRPRRAGQKGRLWNNRYRIVTHAESVARLDLVSRAEGSYPTRAGVRAGLAGLGWTGFGGRTAMLSAGGAEQGEASVEAVDPGWSMRDLGPARCGHGQLQVADGLAARISHPSPAGS